MIWLVYRNNLVIFNIHGDQITFLINIFICFYATQQRKAMQHNPLLSAKIGFQLMKQNLIIPCIQTT